MGELSSLKVLGLDAGAPAVRIISRTLPLTLVFIS